MRWLGRDALPRRYESLDVHEAPDAETAHRSSIPSRSQGAPEAESLQALPYDVFVDQVDEARTRPAE